MISFFRLEGENGEMSLTLEGDGTVTIDWRIFIWEQSPPSPDETPPKLVAHEDELDRLCRAIIAIRDARIASAKASEATAGLTPDADKHRGP